MTLETVAQRVTGRRPGSQAMPAIHLDSWYDDVPLPSETRLLYVPNGLEHDCQPGLRRGFEGLLASGQLAGYSAFELQREARRTGIDAAWRELLELSANHRPTIVLVQHVGGLGLTDEMLVQLRRAAPQAALTYHDCDPFGHGKPMPRDARRLTNVADLAIGCGLGSIQRAFARAGATRFAYAPHAFDEGRFGGQWAPPAGRDFDVVFVGNRNHSRIPGRRLPGSAQRVELVRLLQRRFGERAGIFGRGWSGPGAQGPIAYSDQRATLRSAWATANWDYFPDVPYYFSDRLPIALAAGVPHVTTRHLGYDELFGDMEGLTLADSPAAIVAATERLLGEGAEALHRRGRAAHDFATRHMGQARQARALLARTITAVGSAA